MINSRALVITFLMFAGFIFLTIILFNIQIADHTRYHSLAQRQQYKSIIIPAERGLIRDCDGEVLVYTKDDV